MYAIRSYYGVALGVAVGPVVGAIVGVALGVADGVALGVALGVVDGVALGVVEGVGLGVALGDGAGFLHDSIGQRALAVVDVRDDGEVSDQLRGERHGGLGSSTKRGRPPTVQKGRNNFV